MTNIPMAFIRESYAFFIENFQPNPADGDQIGKNNCKICLL